MPMHRYPMALVPQTSRGDGDNKMAAHQEKNNLPRTSLFTSEYSHNAPRDRLQSDSEKLRHHDPGVKLGIQRLLVVTAAWLRHAAVDTYICLFILTAW